MNVRYVVTSRNFHMFQMMIFIWAWSWTFRYCEEGNFFKNDMILKPIQYNLEVLQRNTSVSASKLALWLKGPRQVRSADPWHGYQTRRTPSVVRVRRNTFRLFPWNRRNNIIISVAYEMADGSAHHSLALKPNNISCLRIVNSHSYQWPVK
jgi:hypothetical protein